ncbi:hypothetical protein J5X84_36000 [Streptosporangiaceae bacterium NEAU-GS5]|nr:hypothetical protein [Streptosporangiaceae bacterium NEAU-GS5]
MASPDQLRDPAAILADLEATTAERDAAPAGSRERYTAELWVEHWRREFNEATSEGM